MNPDFATSGRPDIPIAGRITARSYLTFAFGMGRSLRLRNAILPIRCLLVCEFGGEGSFRIMKAVDSIRPRPDSDAEAIRKGVRPGFSRRATIVRAIGPKVDLLGCCSLP